MPSISHQFVLSVVLVLAIRSVAVAPALLAEDVDFVAQVRPILQKHCYACHGSEKQKSGLRLDIRSEAFKGGDGWGPFVVPGEPAESPLIALISDDDEDSRMPPGDDPLSAEQIATLTAWVEQGAIWPEGIDSVELEDRLDHWSFKPVAIPKIPQVLNRDWPRSPIDHFVLTRLEQQGLTPAPPAEPVIWLRRVTFDLTGLPPTPLEVIQFLERVKQGEVAYADVVQRLLNSPRYGERWAQHWLDVVRYADTHGFEVNTERPNAWPYRDYVIDAMNNDTPYDQFIREQMVGDALGQDRATGFLVTASVLLPGQIGADEPSKRLARQDSLDEIVNNVTQTFLGLSVGCARCHDHKFDPITAKDYYSMQAFVAGVEYADRVLPTRQTESLKKSTVAWNNRIAQIDERLSHIIRVARPNQDDDADVSITNAHENVESFKALEAKFVRFTIHDANLHPSLGLIAPCIDEFEIYTDEAIPKNVALAALGTKVTASGSVHSANHKLEYINDGVYGNSSSWMSSTDGTGWVMFEMPQAMRIGKIVWSRDRQQKYTDRLATAYTLEAGVAEGQLTTLTHLGTARTPEETRVAIALQQEKLELAGKIRASEDGPKAFAGTFRTPDDIHLLNRGDPEQPKAAVVPAVLSALGDVRLAAETPEQLRRKRLAEWIASPNNRLTARVMANRIWQWHFGIGFVDTPNDFGRNGSSPTHPELLDWLARELIRGGWSIKHLHREIVLSATYRQSTQHNEAAAATDADVRLLWRYPSRRLEGEAIRDSILATNGRLDLKMGGPGYDLFNQRGGLSGFTPVATFSGEGLRRMIYAHKVRRERDAVFGAFDCPDGGQSTARRIESTTPIQALNLFNSTFAVEQAAAFAELLQKQAVNDVSQQVQLAYWLGLNRQPDSEELADSVSVVREFGLETLCRALFNSNEFLFIP